MKFSVILTVYNGENVLCKCLESLLNLDYPKDKYELIAVNDGSTDKSWEILKFYKRKFKERGIAYRIFKLEQNIGRIKARAYGVKKAKFDRIVILDVQMRMDKDFLKNAAQYPKNLHLITNVYMRKDIDIFNRVFYLLRKKYYSPYWGKSFHSVEITFKNFKKIPKGTGGFVTNKSKFLQISNLLEGKKIENEDTKLFYFYLTKREKLIKVPDVKLFYIHRKGISALFHLYNRGPRFVDFYLKSFKSRLILLFAFILISLSMIKFPIIAFSIGVIFLFLISMYLSENIVDFASLFFLLPILGVTFSCGILVGILKHSFR